MMNLQIALVELLEAQSKFSDEKAFRTNDPEYIKRRDALQSIQQELESLLLENKFLIDEERPQIKFGGGQGIASPVAWLRVFDSSSPKTTSGWYICMFFGPGGEGFYLSLTQGVNYGQRKKEALKTAQKLRASSDFPDSWKNRMSLGSGPKAKAYVDATPLTRFFTKSEASNLSSDVILDEFRSLATYLETAKKLFPQQPDKTEKQVRNWLIQFSPGYWDLDAFLDDGNSEFAFTVGQHLGEISEGDPVYMWKSGKNAGFVAKGRIKTQPEEAGQHPQSMKYYISEIDEYEVKTRVLIEVEGKLPRPISKEEFRMVSPESAIFRSPQSSSPFPLSKREVEGIERLLNGENHNPKVSLTELADELLIPETWLQHVRDLIVRRRQVIFQGPPGTGKTFLAKSISRAITSPDKVSLVQFHPSYSYEDFVEGFRPSEENGALVFEIKPGPFVQLAERARKEPNKDFVLIIDEINRGNLAKIFGELYFLLEYRDENLSLQYGDEDSTFSLPGNLIIIGTMNTADRSIANLDTAIRRRFAFVDLVPDKEPISGLLRSFLEAHKLPSEYADYLDLVNEGIQDPKFKLGPSYFMSVDIDQEIENVWNYQVIPQLEEIHFGDSGILERYNFERVKSQATQESKDD